MWERSKDAKALVFVSFAESNSFSLPSSSSLTHNHNRLHSDYGRSFVQSFSHFSTASPIRCESTSRNHQYKFDFLRFKKVEYRYVGVSEPNVREKRDCMMKKLYV